MARNFLIARKIAERLLKDCLGEIKNKMARKRKLLTTVGRRRKSKGTVFDPAKHQLVPKHSKISEKEKKELLEKYNITFKELPKILITDPLVQRLKLEPGDVIKIERSSLTAGKTVYYRGVIIG